MPSSQLFKVLILYFAVCESVMAAPVDPSVSELVDNPKRRAAYKIYNFIYSHGTGSYLAHRPVLGFHSSSSEVNGYNLDFQEKANGKHFLAKVYGERDELVVHSTSSIKMSSDTKGTEFLREPPTKQNNIMLYTIEDGHKLYLTFGTSGELRLVSEVYKNDIFKNNLSLHQQWNELHFDIVAVDAQLVPLPYVFVVDDNQYSGDDQVTP